MRLFHKKVLTLLLIIGFFITFLASCAFTLKKINIQATNPIVEKDSASLQYALGFQNTLRLISESLSDSVVNIRATQKPVPKQQQAQEGADPFSDFLKKFFGDKQGMGQGEPQPRRNNQVTGSGFIISKDGYIITNAHVVNNVASVEIQTSNQEIYKGELIGLDIKTDIALIKISPKKNRVLTVAPLGNSDNIRSGDFAIAIGNPFGLNGTFTFGIISAKGRNSFVEENAPYKNYIQSDVTVNPGNSGGPLINIRGQVIGINSAIYSTSGGSIGISFAVPINIAKNVVEQLIGSGYVSRGSIGALIQPLTEDISQYNNIKGKDGVVINDVSKNGAADKAGIQPGDVITHLNGKKIVDTGDFVSKISALPPKTTIQLTVVREKKVLNLPVTLLSQQENSGALKGKNASDKKNTNNASFKWAGMTLMEANVAREVGYNIDAEAKGIIIIEMEPSSKVAESDVIRPGDSLIALSKKPVNTLAGLKKILGTGKSFLVQFKSAGGGNRFLVLP